MRWMIAPLFVLFLASTLLAQPSRKPVLFDTDIGNDMDDPLALALLLASPEIHLRGVTAVGTAPQQRAMMLCRFLTMTGRRHVAVGTGSAPPVERKIGSQYQYYYHPDVLFNRTTKPVKEPAVDFLAGRLRGQGKVTILATGPLTNIAHLLADFPKSKSGIERIILTAGNARADIKAARAVFSSGVPLVVIPEDVTKDLKISAADLKRIFAPTTALSLQTQALHQLSNVDEPNLADVLAAALCVNDNLCTFEQSAVEIDDKGALHPGKGDAKMKVAKKVDRDAFLKWYVDRMASCVRPVDRPVKPVVRGGMPNRVHVAEDYDLDIERRWWMAGKAETKNVPEGSKRACRGVLTHDFDDLLGSSKEMWTAVIFNPVPGPPMGKNTRLNFRIYLAGTDTVRVQIYSLTNGYHRHLVLKDVPQKKWLNLTVDMTQARRPDGTGGPLSEGERIDDIQFYVNPKAELIIDDVFLYDAATRGEKRPFPKRVHYTGLFDSGRQGREWPGTFEILRDRGYFWHAAKSVANKDGGQWIRLHLRGQRPLGEKTHLSFRSHLTGKGPMRVRLVDSKTAKMHEKAITTTAGKWTELTLDLTAKDLTAADEIHFYVGKDAELLVDDVLLYEPGFSPSK